MFTVKLQRGEVTKIVECFGVTVVRNGSVQTLELDVPGADGGKLKETYFVSLMRDDGHYFTAYVENGRGATTQVVRAS